MQIPLEFPCAATKYLFIYISGRFVIDSCDFLFGPPPSSASHTRKILHFSDI